jgi:hypothetical protein
MAKNKFGLGMLAVMFLALFLAGCKVVEGDGDGYKIRCKVDNNTSQSIEKVEFINGDKQNDKVVFSSSITISAGQRSFEYPVSGLTIEYGSSTRKFGVKVTFADATTKFDWSYAGHESKVLVSVNSTYSNWMGFSSGNW